MVDFPAGLAAPGAGRTGGSGGSPGAATGLSHGPARSGGARRTTYMDLFGGLQIWHTLKP